MTSFHQMEESEIIERLKRSDEHAFKWIFDQYHLPIYNFAIRFLKDEHQAEEITQETFLTLWLNRTKIIAYQPILPYLITISKRSAIDRYRKKVIAKQYLSELYTHHPSGHNNTEAEVLVNEIQRLLTSTVSNLPKQQKRVFLLSRVDGLSYEEISQELNISKNTVKQHLVAALKTIKHHFRQHGILNLLIVCLYIWRIYK